jgi:hypothetical protein
MTSVPMDYAQRCGYLPQVFRELISRLQPSQVASSKGRVSIAAAEHGWIGGGKATALRCC